MRGNSPGADTDAEAFRLANLDGSPIRHNGSFTSGSISSAGVAANDGVPGGQDHGVLVGDVNHSATDSAAGPQASAAATDLVLWLWDNGELDLLAQPAGDEG